MFLRARVTIGGVSLAALCLGGWATAPGCGSSKTGAGGQAGVGGAANGGAGGHAGTGGPAGGGAGGTPTGGAGGGSSGPTGALSGTVYNDSAPDLVLPRGLPPYSYHTASFTVTVDDIPGLTTEAAVDANGNYPYVFPSVPVGTHPVHVTLHDLDTTSAKQSYDFFQAATTHASATVALAQMAVVDVHLKWHWELHTVSGTGFASCGDGPRQMYFRDALHGMIVFRNNPGSDVGAVMVTSDGGSTWTVATAAMNPGFVPSEGYPNTFRNRDLWVASDGMSAVSLGFLGPIVQSTDLGLTWARLSYMAPTDGPGDVFYSGVGSSGTTLYLGAFTGGVQSSYERSSIAQSTTSGATWATVLDRCDSPDSTVSCSAPNQPSLPLGFAGFDLACGPAGHCISAGGLNFLVTTDGFQTWSTFAVPSVAGCPAQDSRVIWLPATNTAWAVTRVPTDGGCLGASDQRKITTDGGLTWSAWGPSPVNPVGFTAFGDANTAFFVGGDGYVYLSVDGGMTFSTTGPAPSSTGNGNTKLSVVDATHAWVLGQTSCASSAVADLGRWMP